MSRQTNKDFEHSYRVVYTYGDGSKSYEGPYQTKAAAKGRLSQQVEGWYREAGKTGYVERSTGWERVDSAG